MPATAVPAASHESKGSAQWRAFSGPGGQIEVAVEIWTYNFGPDRLMQRLKIEDGVVVEIRTLGYGYR